MKIAVYQMNSFIGDIKGNCEKILLAYERGVKLGADIVVTPELALTGYSPQDLLEKDEFRKTVNFYNQKIIESTKSTGLIFGTITENHVPVGADIFNSAIFCSEGLIRVIQNKTLIPNYDVFDEIRYFESSTETNIFEFKGEKIGVSICEDIWNDADYWNKRKYSNDPVENQIKKGASLLINISASPYAFGKRREKKEMFSTLIKQNKVPLVYACCVGAQTDLIFDGGSMYFNKEGKLSIMGGLFVEDFLLINTDKEYSEIKNTENSFEEEVVTALVYGVREYCIKTRFKKILFGLSGGIDSALIAYLAVKAVGNQNVLAVMLPSQYSSKGSIEDSMKLIDKLNIKYETIPIQSIFEATKTSLKAIFSDLPDDVTEENMQSRLRGLILMAISNKLNYLLLTTGNKSEIAVGYATLYGDMCGALAPIGDIYKTDVYKIVEYINKNDEIIPKAIIEKPPSAELRYNQTDQDSLPPYEILDKILKSYLEENKEFGEISKEIIDRNIVKKILTLVDTNEFKRKQAAPTLRVSTKSFGYGRRFPIVQGWRESFYD